MTKAAALYSFWSSFGLPAYEENRVPEGTEFPYVTYQLVTDSFGAPVALTGSLYYYGNSLVQINAKTEEISKAIGRAGIWVDYDGGTIWIQKGSPFAQSMGDPENKQINRKVINIEAEFISAD